MVCRSDLAIDYASLSRRNNTVRTTNRDTPTILASNTLFFSMSYVIMLFYVLWPPSASQQGDQGWGGREGLPQPRFLHIWHYCIGHASLFLQAKHVGLPGASFAPCLFLEIGVIPRLECRKKFLSSRHGELKLEGIIPRETPANVSMRQP